MADAISSTYRKLSTKQRYIINSILVVAFLAIGEAMISGGVISRYQTTVLEQVGIYIIMAVSLNIATGYLGQLPLGHAGFMSVGGYACAIFIMRMSSVMGVGARDFVTGSPAAALLFVLGLIFGGLCAGLAGLIIGIPALRLKGDYLAIVTLGFAEIIRVIMQNIDGVLGFELTGGAKGLTGIPAYTNFLNTFIVVAISLFLIHTMMKSRHGRCILSIRDNEIASESVGINVTYYKTLAFVVSAFFAGVGGGLYAGCIGVMMPARFGFMRSIEILVMVVLGGMGSMLGSVISATVLTILPEVLRAFADYRMVVYAVVLIVVMIFRPQGLLGTYDFSMGDTIENIMNHRPPFMKHTDVELEEEDAQDTTAAGTSVAAATSEQEGVSDAKEE